MTLPHQPRAPCPLSLLLPCPVLPSIHPLPCGYCCPAPCPPSSTPCRYMRNMGERVRAPLPLADIVFQHLLAASAQGLGDRDWGAISLALAGAAGLPPRSSWAPEQGAE